jgi:hypothetical protein
VIDSETSKEIIPDEIKSWIESIDREIENIDKENRETDGDMLRSIRLHKQRASILHLYKEKQILVSRNLVFKEIMGGFVIDSPIIPGRRYYYYSNSTKWRQEGKSKYYRCKDINDLLDRFVFDISFRGKKNT